MNQVSAFLLIGYACLLFLGGIMAYTFSGSVVSILTASGAALLVLLGVILFKQGIAWAYPLIIGTIACIALLFLYRFGVTFKVFPAGVFFILSLAALYFAFKLKS